MIVQTFEMDFPNQKIERHLDQDHSVLPRGGRQAVSFLTFMSSSLVKEKKRCQTDTDSWHIPVPDTFQEDVGNSGEIKWGDCWTSKGVLSGKMSYCSAFNLLIAIHCLQHGARRLQCLTGGGISKIVF